MDIKITSSNVIGVAEAISSKSELHRLLLLSALCQDGEKTTVFYNGEASQDVMATVNCLIALGASIEIGYNFFTVTPIKEIPEKTVDISPNESGSTLRFILPIFSALGARYKINVNGRLGERPLSPLYELMADNGVTMSENGKYPLFVSGKLNANDVKICGNVSSQFISGLLMAMPIMGGGKVTVTGDYESKSYVDITVGAMRKFGVIVEEKDNVYTVKSDKYRSLGKINAGGDWSNSAFLLSLGAIAGRISVKGLDINSLQGDKEIINILKKFGAKISVSDNEITAEKATLYGIEIDASNIPDLVPTLAVVASASKGKTKIFNAGRLRLKESDRIKTVVEMINALGGKATETDDGIILEGRSLTGGIVYGQNDHRIVMSAGVASSISVNPVIIKGAQAVNKSYPQFFEVVSSLGLKYKEI